MATFWLTRIRAALVRITCCRVLHFAFFVVEFLQQQNEDNPKRFPCTFCKKLFTRKYNRIVHERTHVSQRNFKCRFDGCGATFYQRHHARRHERSRHFCSICDKDVIDRKSHFAEAHPAENITLGVCPYRYVS